jgi:hypothetical protein
MPDIASTVSPDWPMAYSTSSKGYAGTVAFAVGKIEAGLMALRLGVGCHRPVSPGPSHMVE